jgi:hypothetical protein
MFLLNTDILKTLLRLNLSIFLYTIGKSFTLPTFMKNKTKQKQNKKKTMFLLGTYFLRPRVCFLPDPRYSLETYTPSLSSLESNPRPSPEFDQGPECPRFLESLSMIYLSSYNAIVGGKPKQLNLSY